MTADRPSARRRHPLRCWAGLAALALAGAAGPAAAETPLEGPATRHVNFETAYVLPRGALSLQVGSQQTDPGSIGGTGSQLYYFGADWAVTSHLQLGFATQVIEDDTIKPIGGVTTGTRFISGGVSAKFRFVDQGRFTAAALASVEGLSFRTSVFGTRTSDKENVIGSLHVPISYEASPTLRLHLTPGVSVFPEDLNGFDYYGTVASLGAGLTWQPNPRLQGFAQVNVPLSGGNTIEQSQAISRVPVYTVGARYNFTPKVALEGYVTNGLGISPATGILTFYPDGDEPMFGLKLHYTPGNGPSYRDSYRFDTPRALSRRDMQLTQDGFTVASAGTLPAQTVRGTAFGGGDESYGVAVFGAPEHDFQIEGVIERFAVDGSVGPTGDPTPGDDRYMVGGRIRVFDQAYGDPVSMSGRVLAGRDLAGSATGVIYVGFPITYRAGTGTAVHVNPKAALFGNTEIYGLGLGLNHEVMDGLQLIGEVTPVSDGRDPVWAVGARYGLGRTGLNIDVSATNAIGRHGLGTLVAQDSTRFGLGVSYEFGYGRR